MPYIGKELFKCQFTKLEWRPNILAPPEGVGGLSAPLTLYTDHFEKRDRKCDGWTNKQSDSQQFFDPSLLILPFSKNHSPITHPSITLHHPVGHPIQTLEMSYSEAKTQLEDFC